MRALVLGIVVVTLGGASVLAALHPGPFSAGKSDKAVRSAGPIENLAVLRDPPWDAAPRADFAEMTRLNRERPKGVDWGAVVQANRHARGLTGRDCEVFMILHEKSRYASCNTSLTNAKLLPPEVVSRAIHFGPAAGAAQ